MRRLTVAFVILISAAMLAACGDMGDHFGEFRQAPPGPQTATKITVNMPIIPGSKVGSAKLPMYVTAYNAAGQAITIGNNLANPIVITTNYEGFVTFSSPTGPTGNKYKHLSLQAAPPTITVYYRKPPVNVCSAGEPPVVVTVYNHDANPQFVTENLSGCNGGGGSPSPSPSPSPSTKPTKSPKPTPTPSPTSSPVQPTVKKLTLAMPATPNPLSPGTFTLVVTAYGSNGKPFATGTVLTNPIQLSSNSSCSVSFSYNNLNGTTISLPSAPGSVAVVYSPPSATCTPPSQIVITAFDLDATPQTSQFAILGGTATVASISFSMLSPPNTVSSGVYPLFITAKDSTGATIPYGVSLTNAIQLSSNASCATGFGVTTNPGSFTGTFQLTSTQTQVYIGFAPPGNSGNTCAGPPAGGNVIITGIAAGAASNTFSFLY